MSDDDFEIVRACGTSIMTADIAIKVFGRVCARRERELLARIQVLEGAAADHRKWESIAAAHARRFTLADADRRRMQDEIDRLRRLAYPHGEDETRC